MDDRPLTAFAHPDSDRFHYAAAVCFAVAWFDVQMNAVQAVRAMVSMLGAAIGANDEYAAAAAYEMTLMMLRCFAVAKYGATLLMLQR